VYARRPIRTWLDLVFHPSILIVEQAPGLPTLLLDACAGHREADPRLLLSLRERLASRCQNRNSGRSLHTYGHSYLRYY
jgi:hypothetical protein